MTALANLTFDPGSVLAWAAVGVVPGFLAARVYRGGWFGPVGGAALMLAGVAAAVATGGLARGLDPAGGDGRSPPSSFLAAVAAAAVIVLVIRRFGPRPARSVRWSGA